MCSIHSSSIIYLLVETVNALKFVFIMILYLQGLTSECWLRWDLFLFFIPEFSSIVFPLSRTLQGSVIVILTLTWSLKLKTRIAYIRELIIFLLSMLIVTLLYYIILYYGILCCLCQSFQNTGKQQRTVKMPQQDDVCVLSACLLDIKRVYHEAEFCSSNWYQSRILQL